MANAERMEAQLKALSLISEQGEEGTTRLSYTPEYRKGADCIKKLMEEAGLTVREDAAGLVWGLLPGTDPDAPKLPPGHRPLLRLLRRPGGYHLCPGSGADDQGEREAPQRGF